MTDPLRNWTVTRLSPDPEIVCRPAPSLDDPSLDQAIDTVWQAARQKFPKLYNGRVFCLSHMDAARLEGFWCEFRWVLAHMRDPALAEKLHLRSLAVTGLMTCKEGIVLGRRNPNALYLPGLWQGVPAGSVETRDENDPLDLGAQLMAELEEEVGMTGQVRLRGPFLACEHSTTHIVDLGFLIETDLPFETIRTGWQAKANDEYDELICIPVADRYKIEADVLPTTRAMLELLAS